jgi:hypothetical protein
MILVVRSDLAAGRALRERLAAAILAMDDVGNSEFPLAREALALARQTQEKP